MADQLRTERDALALVRALKDGRTEMGLKMLRELPRADVDVVALFLASTAAAYINEGQLRFLDALLQVTGTGDEKLDDDEGANDA